MAAKTKRPRLDFNPKTYSIVEYNPEQEPYWKDLGNEREIFQTLFYIQRPLVLKGPTGCGKTTFTHRMHWELGKELAKESYVPNYILDPETGLYAPNKNGKKCAPQFPLYIVSGTEGTEEVHLLGGKNYLDKYVGGPLYHWAHTGGILLVNELAEIRKDVQTVFHGPLDKDRIVVFPEIGKTVSLPDHAMLIATYNPGYQAKQVDLKISTKQRLPTLSFTYPDVETEAEIIYRASKVREVQIDPKQARTLAEIAQQIRSKDKEDNILASREGVSTRLMVMAAEMIANGTDPIEACRTTILGPLCEKNTAESETLEAIIKMKWG